jgi:hypothetical protein
LKESFFLQKAFRSFFVFQALALIFFILVLLAGKFRFFSLASLFLLFLLLALAQDLSGFQFKLLTLGLFLLQAEGFNHLLFL